MISNAHRALAMRLAAAVALASLGFAALAHDMVPAAPQQAPLLIQGGTVHTAVNGTLTDTDILVVGGTIQAMGPDLAMPEGAEVLDATGQHVYPSLIALDSQLGLTEIGMVRSTVDTREVGKFNPQVKTSVAFNTDSEVIPTVRHNGVGYVQLVPRGSLLAGRSALVHLDGWNPDDALVRQDTGLHLYWPYAGLPQDDKDEREAAETRYHEAVRDLRQAFESAYRYYLARQGDAVEVRDTRWDAMLPLFSGDLPLFVHADDERQIRQALALVGEYGLTMVLVGGYDAYRLTGPLAEAAIPVIYTHAAGLPRHTDEPYDHAFAIPALLHEAGIELAITWSGSWDSRNLAFAAGQAAAYGLPRDVALAAITATPAKLLGMADLGTLAVGQRASLVVSKGDILDMGQARISHLVLDGRRISLDNRHKRLYDKYRQRLTVAIPPL